MLRRLMLMTAVAASFGLARDQEVHAGGYTVYIINMAKLNYKTPVYYNHIVRSGFDHDVFKSSSACLQSITSRARDNKRHGTDYESYLVVYTDRYPTTPRDTEIGLLSHVAAGSYGKWAGWIVYWAPARNRGYYLNPYQYFHPYGPSAAPASPGHDVNALQAPAPTKAALTTGLNTFGDYRSPAFARTRLATRIALNESPPRTDQLVVSILDSRTIIGHWPNRVEVVVGGAARDAAGGRPDSTTISNS